MTRARSGEQRVPNARMVECVGGGTGRAKGVPGTAALTRARARHRYYTQRASAGIVITEGTFVSPQAVGWVNAPGIYSDVMRDGWKAVTDAVHAKGGVVVMQLWHTGACSLAAAGAVRTAADSAHCAGRASHSSFQEGGAKPVAPSAIAMASEVHGADGKKYPGEVPRALETGEVAEVVEGFRAASQLAKDAGFDGA